MPVLSSAAAKAVRALVTTGFFMSFEDLCRHRVLKVRKAAAIRVRLLSGDSRLGGSPT
jgi:hypothetical protein